MESDHSRNGTQKAEKQGDTKEAPHQSARLTRKQRRRALDKLETQKPSGTEHGLSALGWLSIMLGTFVFFPAVLALGKMGWQGWLIAFGLLLSCYLTGIFFFAAYWVLRYLRRIMQAVEGEK